MELDGDQAGFRQCDVRGCSRILREEGDSPDFGIGDSLAPELPADIYKECTCDLVDLCEDHATLLATFVSDFFDGKRVLRPGRVEEALNGLMLAARARQEAIRRVGDKLGIKVKEVDCG